MEEVDWLQRVSTIRAWQRHGQRAPHKPLLLLLALGRLQREQCRSRLSFAEVEPDLKILLDDFGPPRTTSPGYPFHHLASDDSIWVVETSDGGASPGSNVRALRSSGATGELGPAFADALLSRPALLNQVARYLLDANFPGTVHPDLLSAVGLDLDPVTDGEIVELADARRRRDPAFRVDVLLAYEGRCVMCGWDGRLGGETAAVEAAHIRWFNIEGPDSLDNGLCLCALHHKLLDKGAVGITPDLTVAVSRHFVGVGTVARSLVYDLIGKPLDSPQTGLAGPAAEHVAWHQSQVFRGPARRAPESRPGGGAGCRRCETKAQRRHEGAAGVPAG